MQPLTPKINIFVEEIASLSIQYTELKKRTQTSATSRDMATIKLRVDKIKSKMNSLGKSYNVIMVTCMFEGVPYMIPYTDVHLEDAKKIFNVVNAKEFNGRAIEIKFNEMKSGEIVKL